MRLNCKDVHEALVNCGRLKDKVLPILQYAVIDIVNSTATVSATNLETSYIVKLKGDGDETTKFLVPIAGGIKLLAGKKGDFELTGINTTVEFKFPNGLNASIASLDVVDYPEIAWPYDVEPISYNGEELLNILSRVIYAASLDDSRFHLNGICFDENRVIATDGHRMEIAELSIKLVDKPIIAPRDGVAFILLAKLLDKVKGNISIYLLDKEMVVATNDKRVIMKLIEGEYPDYKRIIPSGPVSKLIMVDRKELLSAVLELKPFVTDRNKGIKITANGSIDMSAKHPDMGTASISVPCETTNSEEVDLIVNLGYMIDALRVSKGDKITMTYVRKGAPIIFSGDDQWSLLMPMKV